MKKTMKILSLAVLFVVSLGVILYPLIANYLSEKNRSLIETQYTETIEQMDTSALDAARAEAEEYNKTLVTIPDKPYTKDALIKAAESYDTLLNVRADGLMGYVEIPAIGVDLPIYHGTEESTLDRGVGHLLGSSLPVGGTGTHCVLTGHSGLAGQPGRGTPAWLLSPGGRYRNPLCADRSQRPCRTEDVFRSQPLERGRHFLSLFAGADAGL